MNLASMSLRRTCPSNRGIFSHRAGLACGRKRLTSRWTPSADRIASCWVVRRVAPKRAIRSGRSTAEACRRSAVQTSSRRSGGLGASMRSRNIRQRCGCHRTSSSS